MPKRIVAIGGGGNGRLRSDGTRAPYETYKLDKEIVSLTGKEHPNFLLIAHAQPLENQEGYFSCMRDIYGKMFGCECKDLKSNELTNKEKVNELIEWADIIYEGGGDTLSMIKLWRENGFDKILEEAWQAGKVMCGVSAGANCWFDECITDSLRILYGDDEPLISMECLGFVKGLFVPHCDDLERRESAKQILQNKNSVGLLVSTCAALEIINDKYRIITSRPKELEIEPYGLKAYWRGADYIEEKLDVSTEYKELSELLKV